ncbi:MAG TPA: outer membrane beta-barrel protein [Alphaproteobacteria bacterium]|nr:outer membrane beta-barrel protein [Alphaproteobacteria bacterium]
MTKTSVRIGVCLGALWASSLAVVAAHAEDAAPAAAAMTPHSYLVFFDFDKSVLTPEAVKIVDQAAADIAAGKPTSIEVTGYTDTVGSDAYNLRLSKRRALAVQAELTRQGVPGSEIAIVAKGKHDLLVPTADGVKEPQNRRASIVYATPAAPPPAPAPAAAAAVAPAAPPEFSVWAQLEAGITANKDSPHSGVNYGHLFTDKSNQLVLNQLLVTAEKPLDTNATDYALGYRLQGMFGTDARYTHFLGELDTDIKERDQLDIVEAWAYVHTPWLTDGGVDIKIGQYVTYLGAETIDPSGNAFYSKSYIFNFGIPLKHTGVMAITHVNPTLDIYTGIDTGVNTTFGDGDTNSSAAFQGGFGLNNLLDGKLTILALTHLGPEDVNDNRHFRFLNDVVATYKATDKWTFVTELNYIHEELGDADGWGAAQYASYALDDVTTLNGRVEVWSDDKNFFVAGFPGNRTFVQFERGLPLDQPLLFSQAPTTYGEVTLGVTFKPPVPAPLQALTIRPEIRYDNALRGGKPFDDGKSSDQFTFGLDFILKI